MRVVTELVLLAGLLSTTPIGGEIVTVFTTGSVAGAVPRIVMITLPPDGKLGIVPLMLPATSTSVMAAQALVPAPTVPVQTAVTPANPVWRASLKVAPFAAARPLLISVMVYTI